MTELSRFQLDLLSLLTGDGPLTGVDIQDRLETEYGEDVVDSRVNRNLWQLRHKSLVRTETHDGQRKFYNVTPDGRRELEAYFTDLRERITMSNVIHHKNNGDGDIAVVTITRLTEGSDLDERIEDAIHAAFLQTAYRVERLGD